jgi:hypothetical protein
MLKPGQSSINCGHRTTDHDLTRSVIVGCNEEAVGVFRVPTGDSGFNIFCGSQKRSHSSGGSFRHGLATGNGRLYELIIIEIASGPQSHKFTVAMASEFIGVNSKPLEDTSKTAFQSPKSRLSMIRPGEKILGVII